MVKASIKGFELRNITHFLGHEREDCYQGFIYYKGQKVGYFSDDSWGGSAVVDFDNNEMYKVYQKIAKEYLMQRYPNDTILHDCYDMIFTDILQLISAHNDFISAKKKGLEIMAFLTIDGAWCSEQAISFRDETQMRRYALQEKMNIEKIFREDKDFEIE